MNFHRHRKCVSFLISKVCNLAFLAWCFGWHRGDNVANDSTEASEAASVWNGYNHVKAVAKGIYYYLLRSKKKIIPTKYLYLK